MKISATKLGTKGVSGELFALKISNKIRQNKSQINMKVLAIIFESKND